MTFTHQLFGPIFWNSTSMLHISITSYLTLCRKSVFLGEHITQNIGAVSISKYLPAQI